MPVIGYKEIKANCPLCGCSRDKIKYWKYKPMQREIFHVHTRRCKHAEDISDEAYVMKAIELGAKRIVFTDHAPFPDNPFTNRMDMEELPEYIKSMNTLKGKYKDRIEILCGLEVEYLPSFDDYIKGLKNTEGIDLLILGQHHYEISNNEIQWSFLLEDKSQEHKGLAEAMIVGIGTGYFDVVAHPDRIFRRVREWDEECQQYAIRIKGTAVQNSVPIEKNYSSMRRKNQYREEFWDTVGEEIQVVNGIDAHRIKDIENWITQNENW